LKAGGSIDSLAFESALWCRHCFGKTETGKDIIAGDPIWPRLTELAAMAKTDPLVWLSMEDVYGDVGRSDVFRRAFANSLNDIWAGGTARALAEFVKV
jgi:mannitol 2-dehydrogenase